MLEQLSQNYRDTHVSELDYLTKQYTEPHRKYHTLEHIAFMFRKASELGLVLSRAQTHAIWWHDAVYIPGSAYNEDDSAAKYHDSHNHLEDPDHMRVLIMINDTKTHVPRSEESAIVCDLDMLILATQPIEYDRYAEAVCAEYVKFYTIAEYAKGRVEWLESVLRKGSFFHTELFKQFDAAALDNIKGELAEWRDLC